MQNEVATVLFFFENATFVEPHRAYTLAVGNKNRRIAWRVSEKRTGEELASWTAARATNYTFATAGKVYVVEARDQSGNRASIDALCSLPVGNPGQH